MRPSPLRFLLPVLAVAFAALPARAQPVQPMIREGVTEKISEHVHVIPDASMSMVPNVGIIVGPRGVFVVDTGMGRKNGEAVVREVRKISPAGEIYLGTTHFHPEHDLGAGGFPPETQLLRSEDQKKDIAEFGLQMAEMFSSRSPFVADLLKGAQFRPANISFEREHTIDLGGGVTVRAIAMGANHTRGDTAFLVMPDNVLFSGDVVMRHQPSLNSPYSTLSHWLASLDVYEQLHPARLVPSHGPTGGPELIGNYRTYFTAIQTRTADWKKQGKTVDEAVAGVTAELQPTYPDRNRLGNAIKAAYQEAK